jgi:Mg-chelatase subunit ChlD
VVRIARTLAGVVAALALLPSVCGAWGTVTEPLPMTADEDKQLRTLINTYGARKKQSLAEIGPRRGPHATHQFIVRQAYLLLERDPAYDESPWKLPALDSVLAWDGVVRQTTGLQGMVERSAPGSGAAALLAPAKGEVGGPSADAEITASGQWNPEYNAAYHYWNPWLKCGEAPTATASCYAELINAIVKDSGENPKAKAASHMSHYIADAICPKHADMVALDEKDLKELSRHANAWFAEHAANPKMSLNTWLASREVTEAQAIIVRASGASLDSPFWQRVQTHIADDPLLNPDESSMRPYPDVGAPSLRAAVGGFLGALHERPAGKDLVRFYNFFDPFYYNGQLIMAYDWSATSTPQFALVTPGSEHLMWESNPALADYVNGNLYHLTRGSKVERSYVPLTSAAGLWSPDAKTRRSAYLEGMAKFVRDAALVQHGSDPGKGDDFEHDAFEGSLLLAVKYVFSALRSSITAIRGEATYAYFPKERKYRVYCDIGNVADESVQIKAIRVSVARDGKLYSRPGWVKDVSCKVSKGARQRVTVELPQGSLTETTPDFYVDIFGRYDETPDLGFWRGEVSQRPGRIMHGMSLPAFDRVSGALDLAICFDVTGSMGSSIDSVRDEAIGILGKLKERPGDLRVALISFRDIEEDEENAFSVTPFSSNIEQVFSTMRSWKADGGGDTPEDQLQAIRMALDMWAGTKSDPREPTKIVVVITDAPPHDPDINGNTQASIADYAERVDPAHIYPIMVGGSTEAHEKAAELAALTGGEVLTAKSGDEVAELLSAAVEKAVATHGSTGRTQVPPWVLFYGGLTAAAGGAFWTWRDRRKRARA